MSDKVTPELVERAVSDAAADFMRAQGFSGGWDHDEFARVVLAATPLVKMREALEEANSALQAFRGIQRGNGWDDQLDQLDEAQTTIRAALSSNFEGG